MGLGGVLLIAVLATAPPYARAQARAAAVAGEVVRLGDVAILDTLPAALRLRAAAIPVARFAPGNDRLRLAGSTVAARARGALPALAAWAEGLSGAQIPVTRRAQIAAAPAAERSCLRATRALDAGDVAAREDFEPATCGRASAALGYDRAAGLARTRGALEPGEVVRAAPGVALSAVRPHQAATLQVTVGPVRVTRRVEVLRGARSDAAVVVRGDDRRVFTAPAALLAAAP